MGEIVPEQPRPTRREDRAEVQQYLDEGGADLKSFAEKLADAMDSDHAQERSNALKLYAEIRGLKAPQQTEDVTSRFDNMSYDEVQVELLRMMERDGAVSVGSAEKYRELLAGKVRVGGELVDESEIIEPDPLPEQEVE